jgi:hypothetical protein
MKQLSRLLPLLALILLPGCYGDDVGTGTLKVGWKLEGKTCESAGVVMVRGDLLDGSTSVLDTAPLELVCSAGTMMFPEVPAGRYTVLLEGLDDQNRAIYEARANGVRVREGSTVTDAGAPLVLQRKLGFLRLRWTFPLDTPTCGFSGINQVEVSVEAQGADLSYFTGSFPCDPAAAPSDELAAPLVSGWLELPGMPPGHEVAVYAFGLDQAGSRTHFGEGKADIPDTGGSEVTVKLEPCDGNCI